MQNTTIVPPAPERTSDMGSVEQHSPARPPFARELSLVEQVAELLLPLVDEFGAGVVNQAAQRIADHDPVEQARIEADARTVRRVFAGTSLLDELLPAQPATTAAYAA